MRRHPTTVTSLYRTLAALAIVALALMLPGAAAAQSQTANPIQLDLRVGFDDTVQAGAWSPIFVTASNTGPDVSGALRVRVVPFAGSPTVYSHPVDLPRGSRKLITLYAADLSAFGSTITVEFVAGSRVTASQDQAITVVQPTTLLVGVWSDTPQPLSGLGSVKPSSGKTSVVTLTAADLPDQAEGWAALDVLVISDADTGVLTPAQQDALAAWLSGGGRLIITGGLTYQRTLSGLAAIAPVAPSQTETVSLAPLAAVAGAPFEPQAVTDAQVAAGVAAPDAQVWVRSGQVPLLAYRAVGAGRVDYLAADPSLEPLRSWSGLPALWRTILSAGMPRPGWSYGFASQDQAAREAVAAVPGVSLPSVLQLCGFLALYIVLVGPVNYLVLSRLKRRELAWFTIPVLIVVFSGVAYLTGFQLRGSRVILHRLAVIQSYSDSDVAEVSGLLGIWSPRRSRYNVLLDPGFLARPIPRDISSALTSIGDAHVDQGQAVTLSDVQVDVGSVQPFYVEGYTRNAPRIAGNLRVASDSDGLHVTGEIVNYSDVVLHDAALVLGGTVAPLGDLPAGQSLAVDQHLSGGQAGLQAISPLDPFPAEATYGYGYYGYDPFVDQLVGGDCYSVSANTRRCNLLNSVMNGSSHGAQLYLVGWLDSVPFGAQVLNANSETVDSAVLIVQLQSTLAGGGQQPVEVPPGLTTWQPLDPVSQTYYTTPYDLYVYAGESYGFRFVPGPLVPPLSVTSFIVHLNQSYDSGEPPPVVTAHNLQTDQWDDLHVQWGDTPVNASRYVDASGGVELSITVAAQSYGSASVSELDVTLLGSYLSGGN